MKMIILLIYKPSSIYLNVFSSHAEVFEKNKFHKNKKERNNMFQLHSNCTWNQIDKVNFGDVVLITAFHVICMRKVYGYPSKEAQ